MPFGNIKKIFWRIFPVQYGHNLKKFHPSENLTFHNLSIFQSLKFRILKEKNPNFSSAKFPSKYIGL